MADVPESKSRVGHALRHTHSSLFNLSPRGASKKLDLQRPKTLKHDIPNVLLEPHTSSIPEYEFPSPTEEDASMLLEVPRQPSIKRSGIQYFFWLYGIIRSIQKRRKNEETTSEHWLF